MLERHRTAFPPSVINTSNTVWGVLLSLGVNSLSFDVLGHIKKGTLRWWVHYFFLDKAFMSWKTLQLSGKKKTKFFKEGRCFFNLLAIVPLPHITFYCMLEDVLSSLGSLFIVAKPQCDWIIEHYEKWKELENIQLKIYKSNQGKKLHDKEKWLR